MELAKKIEVIRANPKCIFCGSSTIKIKHVPKQANNAKREYRFQCVSKDCEKKMIRLKKYKYA